MFFKKQITVPHPDELREHKQVAKDVVVEAKTASDKLKKIFEENHFTIIIAASMGAKSQRRRVTNNGH